MAEKHIRKLVKSGRYSRVVVLPREFLQILKWKRNQKLEIELDEKGERLIIRDAKT